LQTLTKDKNRATMTANRETIPALGRKPPWIKVRALTGANAAELRALMRSKALHTVCEAALCPNMAECWGQGTATFLILGEVCTRHCAFCAVKEGTPPFAGWDPEEPARVAAAAAAMQLHHVVVTSVTRDDLPDGGAGLFGATIRELHARVPGCSVEVLIPDFLGDRHALAVVMEAHPEILGHNMETVPRLYPGVRPQAAYQRSLEVLSSAKQVDPKTITKSGIMVGLGESWKELMEVMDDLRKSNCDILTVGQYLRPSRNHVPVERYYTPGEFAALKAAGLAAGFRWVESGPLVRSSYHAAAQARELCRGKAALTLRNSP
jgi:lipoyl synthase